MQPIKTLPKWLQQHTGSENYLFTLHDTKKQQYDIG